jgi:hypothetical protein
MYWNSNSWNTESLLSITNEMKLSIEITLQNSLVMHRGSVTCYSHIEDLPQKNIIINRTIMMNVFLFLGIQC